MGTALQDGPVSEPEILENMKMVLNAVYLGAVPQKEFHLKQVVLRSLACNNPEKENIQNHAILASGK